MKIGDDMFYRGNLVRITSGACRPGYAVVETPGRKDSEQCVGVWDLQTPEEAIREQSKQAAERYGVVK